MKVEPNTIDISRTVIADVVVPKEIDWNELVNSGFNFHTHNDSSAIMNGEDFQFEEFIEEETMDGDVKDFLQRVHHQLNVDNEPWPDEIRFNKEDA